MIRRLPRWARWLVILLLVTLAIYGIFYAVFTSTAFSRFVLGQVESAVPALSFDRVRGSFTEDLRFDFAYSAPGTQVRLGEASLNLQPGCLWRMTVCIERLSIEHLQVSLAEGGGDEAPPASPEEETGLPEIALPVDIVLESLSIASLLVQQNGEALYQMEGLDASLVWRDNHLTVHRLLAKDPYCQWAVEGEMTFINLYPLDFQLGCESVAGYGRVRAEVSGDLEQLVAQLRGRLVSAYTAEPAPVQAVMKLAPLQENLPATLNVRTAESVRLLLGEQAAPVNSARLQLEGPLLSPRINAEVVFGSPFWTGQSTLDLVAEATTEALTVESLTLLLPEGRLEASGELGYAEALAWDGRVTWENVELGQFAEALDGQLSGQLASEVTYEAGDLRAQVDLETVSGSWLDRPLNASGRFGWQTGTLSVSDFALVQAENRVTVAGYFSLEDRVDLAVNLDVPGLGQLVPQAWAPDISGNLQGRIELAGSLSDPIINSTVAVLDLQYAELQLARGDLQLQWFGLRQRRGTVDLNLQQFAMAGEPLADLSLQGEGNISDHSLRLALDGLQDFRESSGRLQCTGGFASQALEQWQGRCNELVLNFVPDGGQQTWRLADSIDVQARPQAPSVSLSPFCLTRDQASLCTTDQIAYRDGNLSDLALVGTELPLEWLQPFLPAEDMAVAGNWRFEFFGSNLLAEPELRAEVSSDDLVMRWQAEGEEPLVLNVTGINLNWNFQNQQQQVSWNLQTEKSGSSQGRLSLQDNRIAGRAAISGLQLGNYSRLFLPGPEDELAGQVNAEFSVDGTLEEPVLTGQLKMDEGMFNTEVLPVPLRDIQLTLNVNDNRATARGTFQADGSDGEIGGKFVWSPEDWSGTLQVSAEPLVVRPDPDMTVHVAPDLEFNFAPQKITIAGQVRVPEAEIELTELPEQAVSTSPDAVIVGEQEPEAKSELKINTNIEVSLGEEVYFEGFGLETRITGDLRLQQSGGELLRANGKLQLVEGRYQAYGQDLVIRSGDLIFVGDIDNPQLRLEAVRAGTEEDLTVGLRVSGPARDPKVALFSNPDMPQQAQLSYLLTGNPPGTEMESDPQLAAAEAALSYALESDVGTGIARRAGDVLGIEDLQVTAGGSENGTQVGLSGYITPNLLVRYGVGVFDAINTLTLKYRLTKDIYLEATSGESSDVGVLWSFERN